MRRDHRAAARARALRRDPHLRRRAPLVPQRPARIVLVPEEVAHGNASAVGEVQRVHVLLLRDLVRSPALPCLWLHRAQLPGAHFRSSGLAPVLQRPRENIFPLASPKARPQAPMRRQAVRKDVTASSTAGTGTALANQARGHKGGGCLVACVRPASLGPCAARFLHRTGRREKSRSHAHGEHACVHHHPGQGR